MPQQLVCAAYKHLMCLYSLVIKEVRWWHDEMHPWSGKVTISAGCQVVVTTDVLSFAWSG